ncbi:MAG TPA: hypothetical protein VFR42_07745 [Candidatus Acidoferrum sp.]|nr:hypothetical protein [Candidatus Acidoferrum sp.]
MNTLSMNRAIASTFPDPEAVLHRIDPLDRITIGELPLSLRDDALQVLRSFQRETINALADRLVDAAARLEQTNNHVTFDDLKREAQALRDYAETLAPATPEVNR